MIRRWFLTDASMGVKRQFRFREHCKYRFFPSGNVMLLFFDSLLLAATSARTGLRVFQSTFVSTALSVGKYKVF